MTLTMLAANNTVEPTNTPETPTSTFVPTATKAQPTDTPTATLPPTETPVDGTVTAAVSRLNRLAAKVT